MTPLITVIVPVYNNDKYIARCLDSLLAQTFSDFEAVIVNDGSTDHSGDIMQKYAAKDSRFHYIEQKNQGVSVARNKGLDNAKGEYILFLDGDDWLENDVLERLRNEMTEYNLDCVSYMFRHVYEDGSSTGGDGYGNDLFYQVKSSEEISRFIEKKAMNIFFTSQRHLFVRNIIEKNHIRFAPGVKSGEDWLFAHIYSLFIRRGKILYSYSGYNYYQHSTSCLHTSKDPWDFSVFQYIKCYEFFHSYLKKNNIKNGGYEAAYQAWYFLLGFVRVDKKYPSGEKHARVLHSSALIHSIVKDILRYAPVRRKILVGIFLISYPLFSKIIGRE